MSEETNKSGEKDGKRIQAAQEARLENIWSKAMALRGLKKVVKVSLEAAKVPTVDENGEIVDVKFNPSAANAATKAIETANKMLGYNIPDEDEEESDGELTVIFDGAEEYSL